MATFRIKATYEYEGEIEANSADEAEKIFLSELNDYYSGTESYECEEVEEEDESQESYSWSEMAELTHETQVEKFGWCACEEQEQFPYDDCPKEGE